MVTVSVSYKFVDYHAGKIIAVMEGIEMYVQYFVEFLHIYMALGLDSVCVICPGHETKNRFTCKWVYICR